MDFDLSESEYVQKCLDQYRANKALAQQKYERREAYIARSKFMQELLDESKEIMKDEAEIKPAFILCEATRGIIRASTGLRSFISLQPDDVPKARAIAKKVFDIVREERRG